ncbi:hypothetical protein [Massilia sp. CCM 8734]|uniref:hypothetical protein n=1 Tax=Massilia sp. CCM 8734 TaxID=2609283 RepID=UPI00142079D4|nr:hypothetical protein [Massilia sp. CCM 8734]NHZ98633.1 hypothetical protein [Massilia sp. CCM 8734]
MLAPHDDATHFVPFAFEITGISKFPREKAAVLDGKLIEGSVAIGSVVHLVHGTQRIPMRVKGVVIDSANSPDDDLSLTIDLREAAIALACVGDRLVHR